MSWHPYDDDDDQGEAAAKARVVLEIAKRRKKGEAFEQLKVGSPRGNPARTFWGRAWCENLERYSDYESRLPRGRAYLRQGHVYDLLIDPGEIFAYVTGSEIYEVSITIDALDPKKWKALRARTSGQIGNLVDLLGGTLGPGVLAAITDAGEGLFPNPKEIRLKCTCPDWADMCKHIAAVLYGVGVQLDHRPELFFTLRKLDQSELVAAAAEGAGKATALRRSARAGTGVLAPEELSALFGIEITDPESAFTPPFLFPAEEARPSRPGP